MSMKSLPRAVAAVLALSLAAPLYALDANGVAARIGAIAHDAGMAPAAAGTANAKADPAVIAKLQDALIARQQIRELALSHGKRVTKELISEMHGQLSGSAWGLFVLGVGGGEGDISGKIDQEAYKTLVDGGEFFVTAAPDYNLAGFIKDVNDHAKQAGFSGCTAMNEMSARFDFDIVAELQVQIQRLRQDLNALEPAMAVQPLPARQQQVFDELSKWSHNSKITVVEFMMNRRYSFHMPDKKSPGDFKLEFNGEIGAPVDADKSAGLRVDGWDTYFYCNDSVPGFMQRMLRASEKELWIY